MKTEKAYVGGKDTVTIICAQCGRSKVIDVSGMKDKYIPRRVKCSCGAMFQVLFEKRRYFRKGVGIQGSYWTANSKTPEGMFVRALSRNSIGFQVLSRDRRELEETNGINPGDFLFVEFKLDHGSGSIIRSRVVVRSIINGFIGAEFHDPDVHTAKELGFYLMP